MVSNQTPTLETLSESLEHPLIMCFCLFAMNPLSRSDCRTLISKSTNWPIGQQPRSQTCICYHSHRNKSGQHVVIFRYCCTDTTVVTANCPTFHSRKRSTLKSITCWNKTACFYGHNLQRCQSSGLVCYGATKQSIVM